MNAVKLAGRLAILATGALLTGVAGAETIVVDDQVSLRDSTVERPARGMNMSAVEAKFGAPQTRHATVGQPPITRWDYTGFSVFFEGSLVIHSVALIG